MIPRTWVHSVGIVLSNSYIVMVNPAKRKTDEQNNILSSDVSAHTINLVVILEVKEWIVVDITMEVNSGSKRKVVKGSIAKQRKVGPTPPSSTTDIFASARV